MHRFIAALLPLSLTLLVLSCGTAEDCTSESSTKSDCDTLSPGISAPVEQDLPPVPGGALEFSAATWSGYTARWGKASDAVTESSKLEYQLVGASQVSDIATVQQAATISGAGIAMPWTANVLTVTVSGRPENETRAYAVLVRDESGIMALYAPTTATTLEQPPPQVGSGIVVSAAAGGATQISWGAASSEGDTELSYQMLFAATADEIDTLSEARAVADATNRPWLPGNVTSITASGIGSGTTSFVAVIVRNSSGDEALYAPVRAQP